jgi:hypothetical protein
LNEIITKLIFPLIITPLCRNRTKPRGPHSPLIGEKTRNDYIVYYEIIVMSTKMAMIAFMKKEVIITARITPETKELIQSLADKDERTLAWMARKLILEALEARGLLKKQKPGK